MVANITYRYSIRDRRRLHRRCRLQHRPGGYHAVVMMLCRNVVEDYDRWRTVFDGDAAAHREAGLVLAQMWREHDDPNTVYFVFEVSDRGRAEAFINAPDAAQ